MNVKSTLRTLFFAATLFFCNLSFSQAPDPAFETGSIYLKLKDGFLPESLANRVLNDPDPEILIRELPLDLQASLRDLSQQFGITEVRLPFEILRHRELKDSQSLNTLLHTLKIQFDPQKSSQNLTEALNQLPITDYAEAKPLDQVFPYTPNDPDFPTQWNLDTVKASLAWDLTTGSNAITIAVVDDAVLLSHSDLNSQIWVNPNEIAGNGLDDDGNGYIDDINGWDAADNDNNPSPPAASATNSVYTHGTHCAGIASAATDNNNGIAALGFNTRIMAIKCNRDATPGPSLPSAYDGVTYAIASGGADVISMSWGGSGFSNTNQSVMTLAHNNGIVLVAAAGNSNTSQLMYPASYEFVISVGATAVGDARASFSNYGDSIDVMAPGANIYSTLAGSNTSYGNLSGTSMACPLVSGLCGLMLSYDPNLSPEDIEHCIESGAVNIDALNPGFAGDLGAGRIDAFQALGCLSGPPIPLFSASGTNVCPGTVVQFTDNSIKNPTTWAWTFAGGIPATSTAQNPTVTYANPGVYDVRLIVSNAMGADTLDRIGYITVALPTAVMSGGGSINQGGTAFIQVDLTGTPPWDIVYTDGSNNFTLNNIASSPAIIPVSPAVTSTYTVASVNSAQCAGTTSGSATVTVSGNCSVLRNFERIIGGTSDDEAYSVKQTSDCGYLVCGRTFSFGMGDYDGFLCKLDSAGNLIWFQTYGDALNNWFDDVTEVHNGYVATGGWMIPNSFFARLWTVHVNFNGVVTWSRTYNSGTHSTNGHEVRQINDGNLVITGVGQRFVNTPGIMLTKLDITNGNIIWARNWGANETERGRSFQQTADNGFIVTGWSRSNGATNGLYDMILAKFNSGGNLQWARNYGGNLNEYGESVLITPDGGYLIAGLTESYGAGGKDVFVVKTNASGVIQWSKTYGGALDDHAFDLAPACNGGYYILGQTLSFGNGVYDGYLIHIDAQGNHQWSRTYGEIFDDRARGFTRTGDCGLAIVMPTASVGQGQDDFLLIKVDSLAQLACFSKNPTTIEMTVSAGTRVENATSTSNFSNVSLTNTVLPATPVVLDSLCGACPKPVADFSYVSNILTVHFINDSYNATQYLWDFGDGNSDTLENPVHTYAAAGTYSVTLVVSNACNSDTVTKQIDVSGQNLCRHVYQPGPERGKDAWVFSRDDAQNTNYGLSTEILALSWTWSGIPGTMRWFLEFDLTNICDTGLVQNAVLDLYGNQSLAHSGSNATRLQKVNGPWQEYGITWNNQPAQNPTGQIAVPGVTGNNDLTIPVTVHVQSMLGINNNFGWMLRLATEQQYRQTRFRSSDWAQVDRRPKLTIDFSPIYAVASNDTIICPGDSVTLSAAGYFDPNQTSGPSESVRYLWRPAAGLSCTTCPNPKASPDSTTAYEVAVFTCANCAELDTVVVNVSQVEIQGPSDTLICGSDSVQLFATVPGGSGIVYSWAPSTGLSCTACPDPVARPTANTRYVVTATDPNGCVSTDTIEINLAPKPLVPALTDTTIICQNDPGPWTPGIPVAPVSNYYYQWTPVTGVSNPNIPIPDFSINSAVPGDYPYSLNIINEHGCDTTVSILFRVLPNDIAQAGPDQSICGTLATLAATPPALAGSGSWSIASGGGSFSSVTNPNAVVTNMLVGQNVLVWSIGNAQCGVSSDTVIIDVTLLPTFPNAGPDQVLCGNSTTLAGNNLTMGTGQWTLASGGGSIANPSSPNTAVTGLASGLNRFVWTSSNSPCPSFSDTVDISVSLPPSAAVAGPDQDICGTSAQLAATPPQSGNGLWTMAGGNGTFANANQASTTVSGMSPGLHTLVWTVSNPGCPSNTDTLEIMVYAVPPDADAGADQRFCGRNHTQLNGNAAAPGQGLWTLVSGSGQIVNNSDPFTEVNGLAPGVNILVWTISNGVCPVVQDSVLIQVDEVPLADLEVIAQVDCAPVEVVFNDLSQNANGLSWDFGDGTTQATQAGISVSHTYTQAGTYDVTMIAEGFGCRDTIIIPVAVTVSPDPIADFTSNPDASQEIEAGTLIQFNDLSQLATSILWEFEGGETSTQANPTFSFGSKGEFCVKLTAFGAGDHCIDEETVCYTIWESSLFIPTGFTPNGDNLNETFELVSLITFADFEIEIYDRWGKLIYRSEVWGEFWDGKFQGELVPEGAYVFKVRGTRQDGKKIAKEGTVTVLR